MTLMTKALVKWLLLPLAGVLAALDAWSLIEFLELGDPYTWLIRTPWTTWLGLALLFLGSLLLLLFRARPEYGVWFSYIPFVRMWKQMHTSGLHTGAVRFRGVQWNVKLNGDLLDDDPDIAVKCSSSAPHGESSVRNSDRDARRIRRLVLKGHELYLRELLRIQRQ
jgi:hypothetical protein